MRFNKNKNMLTRSLEINLDYEFFYFMKAKETAKKLKSLRQHPSANSTEGRKKIETTLSQLRLHIESYEQIAPKTTELIEKKGVSL